MKLVKTICAFLVVGAIATSCEKKQVESTDMTDATTTATVDSTAMDSTAAVDAQNIVEVASSNPDFSTLVTAVKAAGLVETLSGAGPFTVFAPTNAAFDKLPAGTVDGLLKPESLDKLKSVLTYHVV